LLPSLPLNTFRGKALFYLKLADFGYHKRSPLMNEEERKIHLPKPCKPFDNSRRMLVVGEGAAPSRLANLAISGAYKTPLHGWCYPPSSEVVLWGRISQAGFYQLFT